jgi:hypothetical protein
MRKRVPLRRRVRDRIRTFWRRYWWAVLGVAGVFAFGLAVYGAEGPGLLARLNTAIRLIPLGFTGPIVEPEEPSTALKVARLIAPLVFAYATYRAVFALFGSRLQDVRARFAKRHVIVCGLGDQGQALTESLLGKSKVVVLEHDATNLAVQRFRDDGAIVLRGDATDPEFLERAGVSRARCIVALCGPDAVNAQIAANVLSREDGRGRSPLHAFIHVADPRLYTFLLHHALSSDRPRLEFFNTYERGARSFLVESRNEKEHDSALVIGGGQLGLALLSLMARERFEARQSRPDLDRLRIHLVDQAANERVQLLRDRYSRMDDGCTLAALELDVTSPAFDRILERNPALADVDIAYVCFDDDNLTVTTTLNLLDQARGRFPIVARVSHRSAGLAAMLEGAHSGYADSAVFRPLSLAQACRDDLVLEGIRGQLARQVHEQYRRGGPGGPFDVPWGELPDEGRGRNLLHAAAIASQLDAVGYQLGPLIDWGTPPVELSEAEIERMAKLEHERWVGERTQEGWRQEAEPDYESRVHPDIVAWEELPRDRQDINRRLVAARPAMLAEVGIEISRPPPRDVVTSADAQADRMHEHAAL